MEKLNPDVQGFQGSANDKQLTKKIDKCGKLKKLETYKYIMENPKGDQTEEKGEEIMCLRKKYQTLEKEARQLGATKRKLENRLVQLQKQLCLEEQLVRQLKERRTADLKTLRKDYVEKFETAMNLLKVR